MTAAVTPLEALRRLYEVARKVDASESGEFDNALQGELAVVEAVLRDASDSPDVGVSEVSAAIARIISNRPPLKEKAREAALLDALRRLCAHNPRTSLQINADWDNARSVLSDHSVNVAAAPVVPVAAQPDSNPVEIDGIKTQPVIQVPAQVTDDMVVAFCETWYSKVRCIDDPEMQDAYAAMLAAAPSLEAQPAGEVAQQGDRKDADRWRMHLSLLVQSGHKVREVGAMIEAVDAALAAMAQGDKHDN